MKKQILFFATGLLFFACSKPNTQESESIVQIIDPPSTKNNSSLPYLISTEKSLYLSWVENDSLETTFKYAALSNDNWSSPETIASGNDWFVNWADYPMISINNTGMLANYLTKSSSGTYSYDVNLVSKKDNWSESFIPHDDGTPTEHGFVTMLPMQDSLFQVAWLDGRNTQKENGAMTFRTALLKMDGTPIAEHELDPKVCDCCQTGGAITANGPVFVYRNRSDSEIRDMSIVRQVNGEWTKPKIIVTDNWEIKGCPVNGPRIDAINNNSAVAWFTAANNNPMVKLAFSNNGGESFEEPVIVDNNAPLGRVDIVMIDETRAMVSWLSKENDSAFIKAQIIHPNGFKEPIITISETSEVRKSGFPQMAKFKNTMFFAWTHVIDEESTQIKMASIPIKPNI